MEVTSVSRTKGLPTIRSADEGCSPATRSEPSAPDPYAASRKPDERLRVVWRELHASDEAEGGPGIETVLVKHSELVTGLDTMDDRGPLVEAQEGERRRG